MARSRRENRSVVTSVDVAVRAKVSQSAVSRTFTPGTSVSEQTRAKVLKAAFELGYRPNALARAMISGRSRLIALLVAYLENQFYPVIIDRITRELQLRGYQVLLFISEPGDQDEVVQKILQYQVQGILMASATLSSTLAEECAKTGIPVVMLNRYTETSTASVVISDNFSGGRAVAGFLARGGHRRIGFIAGTEDSSTNSDREAGFEDGLASHGLKLFRRAVGGFTFEGAAKATLDLFAGAERPDAIFVANDHMAFSVMDVVRSQLGLGVPDDVSIVGYDDVPEAAWKGYDLTTVAQCSRLMSDTAISILIEQIENRTVVKQLVHLPANLVVRGSARTPPRQLV